MLADIKRFIPNGSHFRLCGKISIQTNREINKVKGKRIECFFCLMSTFSCPQRYFTPTGRDVYFYIERILFADVQRFIPNGSHFRLCGKISIQTNREINKVKGKRKKEKKRKKRERKRN